MLWQIIGALSCALVAGFLVGYNRGFRKGRRVVKFIDGPPTPEEMLAVAKAIMEKDEDE